MADYESIHGTRVKYLTSDPTLDSSYEGQVWYNSTSGTNKGLVQIKATSSGGNMATARFGSAAGGAGPQSASIFFGGATNTPGTSITAASEEYFGFSWFTTANLNTARYYLSGFGTQSAAVAAGGFVTTNKSEVEEYNGSSWSEVNDIPTAGRSQGAAGTLTAGLIFGAANSPQVKTFEYDGTNWTAGGDLNTGRKYMAGTGTQTAALAAGGSFGLPVQSNDTEEYDGSSWTSVNNFNTARRALTGFGIQTSSAIGGGTNGSSNQTGIEEYDGTNWTTSPATLSTARRYLSGFGTSLNAGVFCGGKNGTVYNNTEEYGSSTTVTTAAAWSSGTTIPISVHSSGSATNGPQNANLMFGGYTAPGRVDTVNEYNGSSWTSGNTTPSVYADGQQGGTQTAAFGAGGYQPSRTNATIEYDGTNWSAGGALAHPLSQGGGCGTLTAGLCFGGEGAPSPVGHNSTQEYDGSSWTTVNNMASPIKGDPTAFGIQTAAIQNSGTNPASSEGAMPTSPSNFVRTSQSYDGTTWTAVASSSMGGRNCAGFGTQSDGVSAGGEAAPATNGLYRTEQWDGTGWTNVANLSTNSQHAAPGGDAPAGLYMGGTGAPSLVNTTQEFARTVETVTASTLTTS